MNMMAAFVVLCMFFGPVVMWLVWSAVKEGNDNGFPKGFLRHMSKMFGVSALLRTDAVVGRADDVTMLDVEGQTLRVEAGGLINMSRVVEVIFVDEKVSDRVHIDMSQNRLAAKIDGVVISTDIADTLAYPDFAEVQALIETSKSYMSPKSRARFVWKVNTQGMILRCELMPYEDNIMAMHFAKVLRLWVKNMTLLRSCWGVFPGEFWLKVICGNPPDQPIHAMAWPILWQHEDTLPEDISLLDLWLIALQTLDVTVLAKAIRANPERTLELVDVITWSESRWLTFLDAFYAEYRPMGEFDALCLRFAAEVISLETLGRLKKQYMGAFWPLWRHYWDHGDHAQLLQMSRRLASRMPLRHQLEWVCFLVQMGHATPLDWTVVQIDMLDEQARQPTIGWMLTRLDALPELLTHADFHPWLQALLPYMDVAQCERLLTVVEANRAFELLQAFLQLERSSSMAQVVARRKQAIKAILATHQGRLSLSEEGEQGGLSLTHEAGDVSLVDLDEP